MWHACMYTFKIILFKLPSAQNSIIAAIDWHSYSQLILRPYGMYRHACAFFIKVCCKWLIQVGRGVSALMKTSWKLLETKWAVLHLLWVILFLYHCDTLYGPGWNSLGSWNEIHIADSSWSLHCFWWSFRLVIYIAVLSMHGSLLRWQVEYNNVCIWNLGRLILYRFYGEDATSTNNGYRAAGYTIELRDTGRYGFQLPADQVNKTAWL